MVLSDAGILRRLEFPDNDRTRLRIVPFSGMESRPGRISYGLSSGGYDVRLGNIMKVFTNAPYSVLDPKDPSSAVFTEVDARDHGGKVTIPPNSFALGVSMEWFRIPRDVIATCIGKSTYHRLGVIVACTPLEPEWEGHITLEVSNTSPAPAVVHAEEGIMQVLFNLLERPCSVSYADKKGIYQNQSGITLPKLR